MIFGILQYAWCFSIRLMQKKTWLLFPNHIILFGIIITSRHGNTLSSKLFCAVTMPTTARSHEMRECALTQGSHFLCFRDFSIIPKEWRPKHLHCTWLRCHFLLHLWSLVQRLRWWRNAYEKLLKRFLCFFFPRILANWFPLIASCFVEATPCTKTTTPAPSKKLRTICQKNAWNWKAHFVHDYARSYLASESWRKLL